MIPSEPSLTALDIVGLAGAAIYAASYLLAVYDRLPSQSPAYYLAKMVAAALVLVSLAGTFHLASAVIQSFFLIASIVGIARHGARRRASLPEPR